MRDDLVRIEDMPLWVNAEMTCAVCGWQWVATYCIEAETLECRKCGHWNPAPELPR